jgi:hypothetical protein
MRTFEKVTSALQERASACRVRLSLVGRYSHSRHVRFGLDVLCVMCYVLDFFREDEMPRDRGRKSQVAKTKRTQGGR